MCYFVVLYILSLMADSLSQHAANAIFYNFSNNDLRYGSCKLRSVRETMDQRTGSSMTESFVLDDIEYKLCRYHVTWDEAQVFCSTHEAHLATLDNGEKTSFVVRAIAASDYHSEDYWIGARKYYEDLWTWDSNQQELSSSANIIDNIAIVYPGAESNDVRCLTIDRRGHDVPIFVPRSCNQQRGFICQRDTDRNFDNKIKMVAASKIGKEEFRLYSGRATWPEAVVQCREEGLQIAEVKSVAEAQALAVSMLRNRPQGIESAWIGGYTRKSQPGMWRWLASGERIKDNEMWQKNFSQSYGGCLLLDRHLCEIPVYVKAKCDRKRDVLCQKTLKKRASKQPVGVIVGASSYWIGFHPLKWSEARKSCESMNASLVVLDSPKTISHMMSLMLDNRAELRHIWTDGRRTKNGQWRWQLNGQLVPAFGKSFMPWCPDNPDRYTNELNCLNLDRDNPDIPLVYGLSCTEKQSYVCQPRTTGEYVSDLISWPRGEPDVVESSEGASIQKLEIDRSGSSGTMSMGIEDYRTTPRALNTVGFLEDGIDDWELEGNRSTKATTSGGNLSNYLTPLARFTFPSFPQFGIKLLASALETSTQPLTKYENQRTKKVKEFFKPSSAPRKSTISPKLFASPSRRYPIDTRKSSQVAMKKNSTSFSSVKNTKFETTSSKKTVENLTTMRPKSRPRSSTTKPFNNSTGSPKYFTSSSIPKTQKYLRRTTRELINTAASKSRGKILKRITTPLPKKRKKLRLTTSSITPYDAVDQDYYDAYETTEVPETEEKSDFHSGNEYEDNYDNPENNEDAKQPKKTSISSLRKAHTPPRKSWKKNETTKKNKDKFDIPIVGEFSRSLQTALIDMLTKGVSRKISESKDKLEMSTTTLPEIVESNHYDVPRERPLGKVKENWSIRPYYAFEGPMVVGLSGNLSQLGNSELGSSKTHSFKFVGKKVPDTSKNGERRAPKIVENRRSQLDNSRPNDKNVEYRFPLKISGDKHTMANNPDVFLEMGRYLKNTFGHLNAERMVEENSSREGPKEPTENNNLPHNYNAFPKNSRNQNAKYDPDKPKQVFSGLKLTYDKNGRKINTYGKYDATLPPPISKTHEKSWQEKLQVSWPEGIFSNANHPVLDESANGRKNYPFLLRKTRSSGESSQEMVKIDDSIFDSLPDLKMSKIMKEVRFDIDQESLRNNLETLSDKISGENDKNLRKKNWKDSWKYILARISKLLDRLHFDVNGDLLKIRIGSGDDEESREPETQSSEESNSRKNESFLNLETPNVQSDSLESTDRKIRGFTKHLPETENGPKGVLPLKNLRTGSPSIHSEKERMGSRSNLFQRYQTSLRSSRNNRITNFRRMIDDNKFRNRYTPKLANFNDSRILAAPAVVRPVGSSQIYSFQPIMPQLHHRLAFDQGLNRFHARRRTKNIAPNGLLLKGEYLPRGTMSRIVRLKNSSHESSGANKDGNQVENDSRLENDTVSPKSSPNQISSPFFSHPDNSDEIPSGPRRFQKNREIPERNIVGKISTNILILKENTEFRKDGQESENDRGRDEIVNYLEGLRDEPSIVSLRLTMDPEETARREGRSRQGVPSASQIAEAPRTVNLRVKFSGRNENSKFPNRLKKKELDKRDNGKSFSRLRNKKNKQEIIEKLSRLFSVKNTSSIWRSENRSVPVHTRFRKSQLAESTEKEENLGDSISSKNSSVPSRQDAANFRARNSSLEKITPEEKSKSNEER